MTKSQRSPGSREGVMGTQTTKTSSDFYDLAVVGSGFGGLGTALRAAELGAKVALFETVGYPGGCASSFTRQGRRYEAGATLFAGLSDEGLFGRWRARHRLNFEVDWIDPVVHFRCPNFTLQVSRDRARFLASLRERWPSHAPAIDRFFATQARVADPLWRALRDPALLPPYRWSEIVGAFRAAHRFAPALRWLGQNGGRVLKAHGLQDCSELALWLNALCQITVQCPMDEADAVFALGTLDYFFQDTAHVRGGIGTLALELVRAIEQLGGQAFFHTRVRGLTQSGSGWAIETKRGTFHARKVALNLLPGDAVELLPDAARERAARRMAAKHRDVQSAYGAVVLYLTLPVSAFREACHIQVVQDERARLEDGHHLFVSVGDEQTDARSGAAIRTATVSTHVRLLDFQRGDEATRAASVAEIQARMAAGLRRFVPELGAAADHAMPASPRTYQRFTGRTHGAVGGIPKRVRWSTYELLPLKALAQDVHLVGDSMFPGQSTLATALGGVKLSERLFGRGSR